MTSDEKKRVRVLTAGVLAEYFVGTNAQWWHRRFAVLRSAGVLSKNGKRHFGTIAAVEAWLTRSHDDAATA